MMARARGPLLLLLLLPAILVRLLLRLRLAVAATVGVAVHAGLLGGCGRQWWRWRCCVAAWCHGSCAVGGGGVAAHGGGDHSGERAAAGPCRRIGASGSLLRAAAVQVEGAGGAPASRATAVAVSRAWGGLVVGGGA